MDFFQSNIWQFDRILVHEWNPVQMKSHVSGYNRPIFFFRSFFLVLIWTTFYLSSLISCVFLHLKLKSAIKIGGNWKYHTCILCKCLNFLIFLHRISTNYIFWLEMFISLHMTVYVYLITWTLNIRISCSISSVLPRCVTWLQTPLSGTIRVVCWHGTGVSLKLWRLSLLED